MRPTIEDVACLVPYEARRRRMAVREVQRVRRAGLRRGLGASCEVKFEFGIVPARQVGAVETGVAHPRGLERLGWVTLSLLQLVVVLDGGIEVPLAIGARIGCLANPMYRESDPRAK